MLFQVAVDAVIAGVELASDKPLPERRMAGIERGVPIVIPVQKVRIFVEALGEMLLAEFFDYGGVGEGGLCNELGRRIKGILLFPMGGRFAVIHTLVGLSFVPACVLL